MKKVFSITLICALFAILTSNMAYSQDEMQAKKYDNPEWKRIAVVKYKPGMYGKARNIIDNYYRKAAEKAGMSIPYTIELKTGDWDILIIWDMKDGIEAMNWEVSPENVKWRKALNEVAGGKEKADEISKEYSSTIARSHSNLGIAR